MVREWEYQAKKAQRDLAESSKKAQDLMATPINQAMQQMNSKAEKAQKDLAEDLMAKAQMAKDLMAQRDSLKKAQKQMAKANDKAMQQMNSKVSNLLSKSKQLSQEELSLKESEKKEEEDEEPAELVNCKVQCQRFAMKQMGT